MFQNCSETGYVNTLPEIKGLILFNTNYTHVGVYTGDGQVIEAKGHAYGVVRTNVRDKKWYKWGKLNWITYIKGEKKEEEEEEEMRFNKIEEIPEYARQTIQKLIDKEIIKGSEQGLNLSEDMIRMFVFNDRAKLYENL